MSVDVFSAHKSDQEITIDSRRSAVVVVDMINEFCKPGGLMVLPGYEVLVPPQSAVIAAARQAGVPVIWVRDSHRGKLRRDREMLKRTPHCERGTWGTEVIDDLDVRDEDIVVLKSRYSSFFQTDLDLVLKDMMVDQLIVFGVVTNICVRSTVHDAFFLGYEVVVPQDCCAATGAREQESSLYDIATHFGIVSDAGMIVAALASGQAIENQIAA